MVPSKTLLDVAEHAGDFARRAFATSRTVSIVDRFSSADREPRQASLRRAPDEVLIGAIGTLRREKNIARLLQLFAAIRNDRPVRLIIVGDGPERLSLETRARDLGIHDHVLFAGHQRSPEQFLEQLDIFALTSDTEQMPYCLIEAMAAGLPVIATDVGDVRSMLPEANQAFVAAPTDSSALVRIWNAD